MAKDCKSCKNPCDAYGSGEPCLPDDEPRFNPDEAQADFLESVDPGLDWPEEASEEAPFDPTNLDFIPDSINKSLDEVDVQSDDSSLVEEYLNGEDSDEVPDDSDVYQRTSGISSKRKADRKHARQSKNALQAKLAKFGKRTEGKHAADARFAQSKVTAAQKSLSKLDQHDRKKSAKKT